MINYSFGMAWPDGAPSMHITHPLSDIIPTRPPLPGVSGNGFNHLDSCAAPAEIEQDRISDYSGGLFCGGAESMPDAQVVARSNSNTNTAEVISDTAVLCAGRVGVELGESASSEATE